MRYLTEEQQPKQPSFNKQKVMSQTQAEQLNLQADAALSDDQYSLPPYAPQRPPYSQPGPPYQPTGNQATVKKRFKQSYNNQNNLYLSFDFYPFGTN